MMEASIATEFRQGWRVLLASSFGISAGLSGFAFYTFGVFVIPLVDAFGWTRGQVTFAATFLIIGTAITAPVIGTIIDKFGARRVGLISMAALGLSYFGLSQLSGSIAMFYAAWLFISLLGGGTTPVVWTRAVNIWFDRSRGLALGLTLAGSGVAGIFGPAICTALIEAYGWRGGYIGVGAIILLIALPIIFVLFTDRAPGSQQADPGNQNAQADTVASNLQGLTLQESLRTTSFWKIALGFFLVSGAIAGLIINIVPLLVDTGLTALGAAQVAGSLGIAVVIGRICIGILLDRFSAPLIARILLVVTAIGCALLTIDQAPLWVIVVSVMSLGLAAAAEVDLVAYLVSRYFGMKAYGKIYGWQLSAFYLGASIGPALMGFSYDHFQSYQVNLYTSIVIFILGAAAVGSLGKAPDFSAET
jgi:MFS family permease